MILPPFLEWDASRLCNMYHNVKLTGSNALHLLTFDCIDTVGMTTL